MWLLAVGCGMVVGKTIIHGIIFSRFLRLKMFRADQVCIYPLHLYHTAANLDSIFKNLLSRKLF